MKIKACPNINSWHSGYGAIGMSNESFNEQPAARWWAVAALFFKTFFYRLIVLAIADQKLRRLRQNLYDSFTYNIISNMWPWILFFFVFN